MADLGRPKTISEIIDRLDLIREELISIQRRLEKMERSEPEASTEDGVEGRDEL